MAIPTLSGSYIDQTYQRLVQTDATRTEFADGLGNPISFGGATIPGGSNTQIQYNNNGAFGGVTNLVWNGTTLSATGSFTGSFNGVHTGSLFGTSSWATNFVSASNYVLNSQTGSFATTGSNSYKANQTISGSLVVTGSATITGSLNVSRGITGSLRGTASWANNAVTSSYPITVNGSTLISVSPAGGGAGASTNNSIFFGDTSGIGATNAYYSNFLGQYAGYGATNANTSNFLGNSAGYVALNANGSNFFGEGAGQQAENAPYSNFFGSGAGANARNASYSTLIGYQVGYNSSYPTLLGIESNNIIIGTNITLAEGTKDSINLGGIIFATGSYFNPYNPNSSTEPYSGSQYGIGKVGINKVSPSYTLDVSGSINFSDVIYQNGVPYGGGGLSGGTTGYIPVFTSATSVTSSYIFQNSNKVGINKVNPTFNFEVSGSVGFPNLATSASVTNVITINPTTGQLYYTASSAIGGGGGLSGGTTDYIPLFTSATSVTSSYLNQSGNILKTTSASVDVGLKLDFTYGSYTLGGNGTTLIVNDVHENVTVNKHLEVSLGSIVPYYTVSGIDLSAAAYDITGSGIFEIVDTHSGAGTFTFPNPSGRDGQSIFVINTDAYNLPIDNTNTYAPYNRGTNTQISQIAQQDMYQFVSIGDKWRGMSAGK